MVLYLMYVVTYTIRFKISNNMLVAMYLYVNLNMNEKCNLSWFFYFFYFAVDGLISVYVQQANYNFHFRHRIHDK